MSVSDNEKTYPSRAVGCIFEDLRRRWYPASTANQAAFTRLAKQFGDLMQRLEDEQDLRDLDCEFYPEVKTFGCDGPRPFVSRGGNFRKQFYFCLALLQLMENVYLDLKLEDNFDHPDNQGWVNTFHRWCGSPTLRYVWLFNASMYGERFRSFAGYRFGLAPGKASVRHAPHAASDKVPKDRKVFEIFFKLEDPGILRCLTQEDSGATVSFWQLLRRATPKERSGAEASSESGGSSEISIGFVVVDGLPDDAKRAGERRARVVYVWVEKCLRRIGIARLALMELARRHRVVSGEPLKIEELGEIKASGDVQRMLDEARQDPKPPNPEAQKALRTVMEQYQPELSHVALK